METANLFLRCQTNQGIFWMDFDPDTTMLEIKGIVANIMSCNADLLQVKFGKPPQCLGNKFDAVTLDELQINSDDTVIFETIDSSSVLADQQRATVIHVSAAKTLKANSKLEGARVTLMKLMKKGKVNNSQNEASCSKFESNCSKFEESTNQSQKRTRPSRGIKVHVKDTYNFMTFEVLPRSNSSLFISVNFCITNGDLRVKESARLRLKIVDTVSKQPAKYNKSVLGMPAAAYCEWILHEDHWGGARELTILSKILDIEIVALDTITAECHRFGLNNAYQRRIFVIYDGLHYNPLKVELIGGIKTIFKISDNHAMEMALEIARETKSMHTLENDTSLTLRCEECDSSFSGDEAREHAIATCHAHFTRN